MLMEELYDGLASEVAYARLYACIQNQLAKILDLGAQEELKDMILLR